MSTREQAKRGRLPSVLTLSVLTAALLSGCHNNYETPPPRPALDILNKRLQISLQTIPAAPRQMDPTTFTVRLSDARHAPLDGASVTGALVMPGMDMGDNGVALRPQGSGVYAGTGRFSMDGDWDVVVTAARGRDRSIQTFRVRVR